MAEISFLPIISDWNMSLPISQTVLGQQPHIENLSLSYFEAWLYSFLPDCRFNSSDNSSLWTPTRRLQFMIKYFRAKAYKVWTRQKTHVTTQSKGAIVLLDKMRAHKVQAPTNFCQKAIQGLKDKFHSWFSFLTSYTLECKIRGMGQTEVQNLSPKNSGVFQAKRLWY